MHCLNYFTDQKLYGLNLRQGSQRTTMYRLRGSSFERPVERQRGTSKTNQWNNLIERTLQHGPKRSSSVQSSLNENKRRAGNRENRADPEFWHGFRRRSGGRRPRKPGGHGSWATSHRETARDQHVHPARFTTIKMGNNELC